MPGHADILDGRESLGKPFAGSLLFHAAVFALLFAGAYSYESQKVKWGFQNAGGGPGSVAINAVKTIPLPERSGRPNPLANESESRLPQAPKRAAKPEPRRQAPDPAAIPLRGRVRETPSRADPSDTRYRPQRVERPNQVYSREAPALVSNLYAKTGSGNVGVGPNGPLGTLCGAYAAQIQQLVAARWQTGAVDAHLQSAPPAVFSFVLHKNGAIDGLERKQSSGNYQVDTSAQRALLEAAPFPPISCDSGGGQIEFWFQLRR